MFWHLRTQYLAPDDGFSAGGATGDAVETAPPPPPSDDLPPQDPTEPRFSDKDMAAMRRKHERELKVRDKAREELETRLAALENPPEPLPELPTGNPSDKSAGELEILRKRHEREMEQARSDAAEARKIAEDERQKRRNVERDRALSDALSLSGVADKAKPYAKDHFEKKIIWDQIDETWVYKTKQGNLVDIADGIIEEMPDMFKSPAIRRGGAGTQSGLPPTRARISAQLETERHKLRELEAKGGKSTANVLAFTKQLRIVKQLESQVNAT